MTFDKLKKWTNQKVQDSSQSHQYRTQDGEVMNQSLKISAEFSNRMNRDSVDSSASMLSTVSTDILSRRGVDKDKMDKFKINTNITPTASLQNLENFSQVSLEPLTPIEENFPADLGLRRCSEPNRYLPLENLNAEEAKDDGETDYGHNQGTSTQGRLIGFDEGRFPIFSGEIHEPSASSLHDQLRRSPPYYDGDHGFDFGFAGPPLRSSADKSKGREGPTSPDCGGPFEPSTHDVSGSEGAHKGIGLAGEPVLLRKERMMGYGLGRTYYEDGSDESLMADSCLMYKKPSDSPENLNLEDLDDINVKIAGSVVSEAKRQLQPSIQEMNSISDPLSDTEVSQPPSNSPPLIPKKSGRRYLTQDSINDTPKTPSGLAEIAARVTTTDEGDASKNESEDEDSSHHLPYYEASKAPKPFKPRTAGRFQRVFVPSILPRVHPRVTAAEVRIAAYKASTDYIQRNEDLTYINECIQANKFYAELFDNDNEDDADIREGSRNAPTHEAYHEAMDRITEMSVGVSFRAFLQDMTFVRMYRDEMRARAEEEGWKILEILRKRGVTSSTQED